MYNFTVNKDHSNHRKGDRQHLQVEWWTSFKFLLQSKLLTVKTQTELVTKYPSKLTGINQKNNLIYQLFIILNPIL